MINLTAHRVPNQNSAHCALGDRIVQIDSPIDIVGHRMETVKGSDQPASLFQRNRPLDLAFRNKFYRPGSVLGAAFRPIQTSRLIAPPAVPRGVVLVAW
jgi:hypothetical protein